MRRIYPARELRPGETVMLEPHPDAPCFFAEPRQPGDTTGEAWFVDEIDPMILIMSRRHAYDYDSVRWYDVLVGGRLLMLVLAANDFVDSVVVSLDER